jgi:outer membrane murein-binding lipoprotein Lpp
VLFDTYLKGQGNPDELKDYIAAGVENTDVINIIASEIVEWQAKAADLKKAEQAMREDKEKEK